MDSKLYNKFISSLNRLSTEQYKGLKWSLKEHDKKKRNAINLQKVNQMFCPHCKSVRFIQWGVRNDLQRYKCKECHKTFNSLTSTPLARLRKKGRWFEYSKCLKNGKSVRQAASICGVHRNTAFKWRHRFLENAKQIEPVKLRGIVEFEASYFKYSEKGQKKFKRETQRPPVCVLVGRDRNMNTFDKILQKLNSKELSQHITPKLSEDVLFCSDSNPAYIKYAIENGYRHGKLNISKGIRVVKDIVHIKNVNCYHRDLKAWMRRFRGVATKYLDSYLSWYRELDEYNMETPALEFLLRAKTIKNYYHQP